LLGVALGNTALLGVGLVDLFGDSGNRSGEARDRMGRSTIQLDVKPSCTERELPPLK
jgi:hypothetical protein